MPQTILTSLPETRLRRGEERGHARHGWLDSRHTFSFADYHDPAHMGFRSLRVINDDRVVPGAGFPTHPHRDMEILTYVLDGAIEHRDSMGNGSVVHAGEVQRMTAGTGVLHSEYNHSQTEPLRFLQIWIRPGELGLEPGYEQRELPPATPGELTLIASPDGARGSLTVHQDARVFAGKLADGERLRHPVSPARHLWLQVARGSLRVRGETLREGDGFAVSHTDHLELEGLDGAELLLFDLA